MKRKTAQMVSSKSSFFPSAPMMWWPRSAATAISLSILNPSQRQHANQLAQHGNDLFPLSLLGRSKICDVRQMVALCSWFAQNSEKRTSGNWNGIPLCAKCDTGARESDVNRRRDRTVVENPHKNLTLVLTDS